MHLKKNNITPDINVNSHFARGKYYNNTVKYILKDRKTFPEYHI
jgi:hypothetical protein